MRIERGQQRSRRQPDLPLCSSIVCRIPWQRCLHATEVAFEVSHRSTAYGDLSFCRCRQVDCVMRSGRAPSGRHIVKSHQGLFLELSLETSMTGGHAGSDVCDRRCGEDVEQIEVFHRLIFTCGGG